MQWSDEAVILNVRRHGDSSVVVEALTRAHGRHLGLVRGGRSRAMAAILQPGNSVALSWRARLDEHLGQLTVEPLRLRAGALIASAEALFLLQTLAAHLHLLAEREPHAALHGAVEAALDGLADAASPPNVADLCALLARFELLLLDVLGFGLDLSRCARTGATGDLVFVSPRSGRAVSRLGAEGFESRLLPLPRFLLGEAGSNRGPDEIADGLRLTGHFLLRDLYAARTLAMPAAREELIARMAPRRAAAIPA